MKTKRGRRRVRKGRKLKLRKWPSPSYTTLKTKVESWITVNVGGAVASNAYSFPLNFPTRHMNAGGTYGQMTNVPANFAGLLAVFDEYRVVKLTVKFVSNYLDTQAVNTDIPLIVYFVRDIDDVLRLNEAAALNAGAIPRRIENTGIQQMSMSQLKSKRGRYLNTAMAALDPTVAPAANSQVTFEDAYGSIKLLFPNLATNQYYGRIYAIWETEFKGLRNV